MDQEKRKAKRYSSVIVLAINIILFVMVFILFAVYDSDYNERLWQENLSNIENLNRSSSHIAASYFDNRQTLLANIVKYAGERGLTYEETLAYICDSNSQTNVRYQLIGTDYTGYQAERDESGGFAAVTYENKDYSQIQRLFSGAIGEMDPGDIALTPVFTDNHTGRRSFAQYSRITLMNAAGETNTYTLLSLSQSETALDVFNYDGGYQGSATALIDSSGNYILNESAFKSDNFYQYLYVFNDLSLDERTQAQQKVLSTESGELYYNDSQDDACVFYYSKVPDREWYCVTCVPLESFQSTEDIDIDYMLGIVIVLMVLLGTDVLWLWRVNRSLKTSMEHEMVANNAKTEFLSRMSHDIRTPLNGIIGMTQLAKDEPNPPQTQEYLDCIDVSGKFLLGLVNDVLDMSKVESGNMKLYPEPYRYSEFCDYIEAVIMPLCQAKHIEFKMVSNIQPNTCVMFDRLRINQIMFNLLSNAVKFTPEGGQIELNCNLQQQEHDHVTLEFYVRDNGVGMSKEFQERLYDAFSQENANASATGTGLGLAIVKKLVDLMDGSISVESELSMGTTFRVQVESQMLPEQEDHLPTEQRNAEKPLAGYCILLCEDNSINATIACKILEKHGAAVDVAADGRIGVLKFSTSAPRHYNAVLMDIKMPVMDGLAATRAIRALDREDAKYIPIIAMTANAYDTDVQNCIAAGMDKHLAKPIDTVQMINVLVEQISARGDTGDTV